MIKDLNLLDLHNPKNIIELFHRRKQHWIVADNSQAFQEWPGSVELWQKMENGQLLRVQRWLKKSVIPSNGEKLFEW